MNSEQKVAFGAEIRARRKAKGWNQAVFAGHIGTTPTTVGRWENGRVEPQPDAIGRMISLLGFTEEHLLSAFGVRPPSPQKKSDQYTAFSFATAVDRLGSFERLDEDRGKIEDAWPVPQEPNEYGSDEKWFELLQLSPDSGGVVFHKEDGIVGFWRCLAVFDETYFAILRGENVNQDISRDNIVPLTSHGTYKMYFVDLFLQSKHNNITTRRLLAKDFIAFLREAAAAEIFFDRIVANITGILVRNQCQGLGFRKVIDHSVHKYYDSQGSETPAEIFELKIGPDAKRLFSHDPDVPDDPDYRTLANLYAEAGLYDPTA